MFTDEQLADALDLIDSRYQKIVAKYLQKVGDTILKIGKLNQSSINLLIQLRRMGVDVKTIERELQRATDLTKKDIKDLYQRAAEEANTDARFDYITKGVEPDSVRWEALVESIWRQTAGAMENLSKSTMVAEGYREVIDEAVQAVSMSVTDYNSTIRDTVKKLGSAGLQVKYQSGAKKRLDSAVRMNILDGVRQVQQQAQELIGEEIGADGVQLTAHPMSAPDHEPVQGRIFDKENFALMQSGRPFQDVDGNEYDSFSRPITQWHCRHLVYNILLGISRQLYSKEQLQQWKDDNRRGVTIGGQHYTRYEASQLLRRLELAIRKQKDTAILAKACGDDTLRRECQSNITKLTSQYKAVAEAAGLKPRFEKTRVEGFDPIKVKDPFTWEENRATMRMVNGARITNVYGTAAEGHAERYYGLVRSMTTDVEKIAKTTGYSKDVIQRIKDYIFVDEHDLGGPEPERFAPSFAMAQSWQRLIAGNPEQHDLTMLQHEIMERELIESGLSQYEAHIETSKKYNYAKESDDYYAALKKRNNKK